MRYLRLSIYVIVGFLYSSALANPSNKCTLELMGFEALMELAETKVNAGEIDEVLGRRLREMGAAQVTEQRTPPDVLRAFDYARMLTPAKRPVEKWSMEFLKPATNHLSFDFQDVHFSGIKKIKVWSAQQTLKANDKVVERLTGVLMHVHLEDITDERFKYLVGHQIKSFYDDRPYNPIRARPRAQRKNEFSKQLFSLGDNIKSKNIIPILVTTADKHGSYLSRQNENGLNFEFYLTEVFSALNSPSSTSFKRENIENLFYHLINDNNKRLISTPTGTKR